MTASVALMELPAGCSVEFMTVKSLSSAPANYPVKNWAGVMGFIAMHTSIRTNVALITIQPPLITCVAICVLWVNWVATKMIPTFAGPPTVKMFNH